MTLKELFVLEKHIKAQRDWCNYQLNQANNNDTKKHYEEMKKGYEDKLLEIQKKIKSYDV